jgi:hypothetical protein
VIRAALSLLGVGIMYLEGQHQPDPGIGFAFAMALILGAALLGCDDGCSEDDGWRP